MILRTVALAAGITGAAGLSQFPEFSQQYMQRLGGAVDELARQVDRYEADAAGQDMTLPTYLDALAAEGPMAEVQAGNMAQDIARHAALSEALAQLKGAGPFTRARLAGLMGDRQIVERAWEAYQPAAPLTFEGVVFAAAGFLVGWLGLKALFAFLAGGLSLFRRPTRRSG